MHGTPLPRVSAAICQRLLPLFCILLAGTTRVRAVRIVASERADCVKDRSPRTKVLSEDTDSLHGYPSQYQHHNEDPLESLPCPCPRIRLTRRICSFLCCHEQQVTKYFLAGITSPPKKEIIDNGCPPRLARCSPHGGRVIDCLRKNHGRCVLALVLCGLYLGISTTELTASCQF